MRPEPPGAVVRVIGRRVNFIGTRGTAFETRTTFIGTRFAAIGERVNFILTRVNFIGERVNLMLTRGIMTAERGIMNSARGIMTAASAYSDAARRTIGAPHGPLGVLRARTRFFSAYASLCASIVPPAFCSWCPARTPHR
ncbi:MAG: hypothetical protein KF757_09880 [Phycisphaeraceae bacterium]|nr:hypothetical protein [Phycisphaeraceae bacterium]MCW5763521.1 hypothetical protein [Phycisphaeraceae bacterium]